MALQNYVCITGAVVSLVVQAGASRIIFGAPKGLSGRGIGVMVWFLLCGVAQLRQLMKSEISPLQMGLSVAAYAAGLLLFQISCRANQQRKLSVAYAGDEPNMLLQNGPYRYIRHPYYASYLVMWAAGLIASPTPLLFALFFLTVLLYRHAARYEEQKFLASSIAHSYREYKCRTGAFIPPLTWSREARASESATPIPSQAENRI